MIIIKTFGDIVKYVRETKNMSVAKLSQLSGVSVRQIHRIESSEYLEFKSSTILLLSDVLEVDLVIYFNLFSEFNDLSEYLLYCKLQRYIKEFNISKLKTFLDDYNDTGIPDVPSKNNLLIKAIMYCKAMVITETIGDYKKAQQYYFRSLAIQEKDFCIDNLSSYIKVDFDILIIQQIAGFYIHLNKHDLALEISLKLSKYIENKYYNNKLPYSNVIKSITNSYSATLCHISECYLEQKNYNESLQYANKGITFLIDQRSSFCMEYLYFIAFECCYMLNDLDEAKIKLNKAISTCIAIDNIKFASKIKKIVNDEYPLLNNLIVISIIE